ncbi:conserved hypothetical protein [Leishmania mexicana MHOM/GT/2001/U1103]|uniref:Uncharacterized protein n=1 Tax=Leishmania mexicana (strain MHOM/GT/2001/U1103) TaxID=929439 RepID=E9B005_LEIMU|nr:conserved hypothetical protein [Leishmania mexicana MHOM/GT/2001/U1103]CBZ28556.1 conserved hypothetical protein [Leishmania mexicana MHOM/GT/2001/U1103]
MVFSIPSYLGVGDRYKKPIDARAHGATFLVSRPKTGANPDALFDKELHHFWNGERGGDPEAVRRRQQLESAKKNLTPNGFAYSSPTPEPAGLGSYFGCFQSTPYAHIPECPKKHDQAIAKRELPPRGVYTSPAQKGSGYSYAHVTLSDVGSNYIATIYEQQRINEYREREEWKKKMPAEPFRPAGREGFTFDESPATGTSRCYIMTIPFQEKRPEPVLTHFRMDQPWRPAGYVEDKPTTIEYWEDPYRGYDPRKEPKEYVKKPSDAVFLPSSPNDNFWYTQSIVFKRI